nr:transcription termination/antitermination protein NusA [Candidatus Woesebacteria bacterium]
LVKQLFQKEVPEIDSGTVVIKGVVREPGERTKISVHSDQTGVDPVGACVGQKGMRVKAVTEELGGAEKIDIIQYNSDDVIYIREALSPAKILSVDLDKKEKRAIVHVDVDQAPLAIGQRGVNVNLAGALTGYTLDVVQKQGEKVVEEEAEVEEETPAVEEPTDAPVEETPTEEVAETPVDEISEPEETPEPAEEAETPEPAEETPSENSEEAAA